MAFNNGKPYHGSQAVSGGNLIGQTGNSDYFFFICPNCNDGQVLRVLEYEDRKSAPPVDRQEKKAVAMHFNLALHLYCPKCQFEDYIKLDNNHRCNRLRPSTDVLPQLIPMRFSVWGRQDQAEDYQTEINDILHEYRQEIVDALKVSSSFDEFIDKFADWKAKVDQE